MKKLIIMLSVILLLSGCASKETDTIESEGVILEVAEEESTAKETPMDEESKPVESTDVLVEETKAVDQTEVAKETVTEVVEEIKPALTLYQDETSEKYGYNADGQPVTEAIYTLATEFVDGYAVVSEGFDYEGAQVLDESMKVVMSNDYGIYNYGYGYFGIVEDFQVSPEGYNKLRLVKADGTELLDQAVFEIDVYNESMILVADHIKGWLIDENGQEIEAKIVDPKLVEDYKMAEIIEGNFVLYLDGYKKEIYTVIDAGGALLESTIPQGGALYTDLGNGYDVKHVTIIDKRFVTVTVPEISLSGDTSMFAEANGWFASIYDPQSYLDLSVDDVYDQYEVSFETKRLGNVLEVDMSYYWYGFGAAHPNYAVESYHINLTDGSPLDLTELFRDPMIYDTLSRIVREKANEAPESYFDVEEISVGANTSYWINQDSITFYYSPYEIAAYAMGIPEFEITLADLEVYLDPTSNYYEALMAGN